MTEPEIQLYVARYNVAKLCGDSAEAKNLADELLKKGVMLKDTPNGAIWYQKV